LTMCANILSNGYGESLGPSSVFGENDGCPNRVEAATAGLRTSAAAAVRLFS
jgi:hypothetical protein